MRNTASIVRTSKGFTLVEVMMAATILTVGFMGLIQAVTISSGMMDAARRQTLASQILQNEIEKLRLLPWDDPSSTSDIKGLTSGPIDTVDAHFDSARESLGDYQTAESSVQFSVARAVYDLPIGLREVTITVTWTVKSSRRNDDSTPVIFTYTRVTSAFFGQYGLNLSYQRS